MAPRCLGLDAVKVEIRTLSLATRDVRKSVESRIERVLAGPPSGIIDRASAEIGETREIDDEAWDESDLERQQIALLVAVALDLRRRGALDPDQPSAFEEEAASANDPDADPADDSDQTDPSDDMSDDDDAPEAVSNTLQVS